jgi:hypothetical protein
VSGRGDVLLAVLAGLGVDVLEEVLRGTEYRLSTLSLRGLAQRELSRRPSL